MKVLFAVKNESLSNAIIEKYRRKYKEILTFKNVYYYNAIINELQNNKDYDRILISEELEDFANNNNYDTIDKFIFDKLDSISDEANDTTGREISIIFICTDRRQKGDELLSKLFSIGVYNALIGDDRTYDSVCSLIKNPRTKKDAKNYYKIDVESSNYRAENENGVNEVEIQNILAHFRRLGKSTEKYAKSFDNIAGQYNEEQLRIIANCLPPKVKSVLASTSEKYKKLASTSFGLGVVGDNSSSKNSSGIRVNALDGTATKSKITKPIVIPAGVKSIKPKKASEVEENTSGIKIQKKPTSLKEQIERSSINESERNAAFEKQKAIEKEENGENINENINKKIDAEKLKVESNKDNNANEDIFADEIFNNETEVKDKVEKFDEDIFDEVLDNDEEKVNFVPEKEKEEEKLTLDDDDDEFDLNFNDDILSEVEDVIAASNNDDFEIGSDDLEPNIEPKESEFGIEEDMEDDSEGTVPKSSLEVKSDDDDGFDFDDIFGESEEVDNDSAVSKPEVKEEDDDDFDFDDIILNDAEDESLQPKVEEKPEVKDVLDELDFEDDIFGESEAEPKVEIEENNDASDDLDFDDDILDETEDVTDVPEVEKKAEVEDEKTEDDIFDFDDDDILSDISEESKAEVMPEVKAEDDIFDFDDDDDDIFADIPEETKVEEPEKEDDLFDDIDEVPGLDELNSDEDMSDIPGLDDFDLEKTNDIDNKEVINDDDELLDIPGLDEVDSDDVESSDEDDFLDIPGLDDLDDFENVESQPSNVKDENANSDEIQSLDDFDEELFDDDDIFEAEDEIQQDVDNDNKKIQSDLEEELLDDTDISEENNVKSAPVVESIKPKINYSMSNLNKLLTKDKKIVTFVGTTKNGTSFLVNNLAKLFSSIGINTAILDMTKNKNAYYMFVDSEDEKKRKVAINSFKNLENGYAEGINASKNLTVYTNLPTDSKDYNNAEVMFSTLIQNHSLVLVDCDFDTDPSFFALCQEIYLVQSLDVLTVQPLYTFLRELQLKEILEPEKLRVVINKDIKVKDLTAKKIIGGISYYKDPAMTVMVQLFNKDMVQACSIPFEPNTYSKYLEAIATCNISLSGYSKAFMAKLKNLGEMIYPLNSKPSYASSPITQDYNVKSKFSTSMTNTLNEMKKKF